MLNLKKLKDSELNDMLIAIKEELKSREAAGNGFHSVFEVRGKALRPATYKQYQFALKLAEKTNSDISANVSTITRRMESIDMSDAIALMKDGKRIRIVY